MVLLLDALREHARALFVEDLDNGFRQRAQQRAGEQQWDRDT
jgi:hypothetical protein